VIIQWHIEIDSHQDFLSSDIDLGNVFLRHRDTQDSVEKSEGQVVSSQLK
jgi:hypothetical protein